MQTMAGEVRAGAMGIGTRLAGFVASTFATISLMVLLA